jgi:hypothetical protein
MTEKKKRRFFLLASLFWAGGALYANVFVSIVLENSVGIFFPRVPANNVYTALCSFLPYFLTDILILFAAFTAFVGIVSLVSFLFLGFSFSCVLYGIYRIHDASLLVTYLVFSLLHTLLLFAIFYLSNAFSYQFKNLLITSKKQTDVLAHLLDAFFILFFLQVILFCTSNLSLKILLS